MYSARCLKERKISLVFVAVGAQLNAVLLGHDQRHLQNVDGIESQPLAIQGCVRIDVLRRDLQIERLDEQRGEFPLETDSAGGADFCMSDALSDIGF